jgi:RNA polymerase-associated protein
MGESMVVKRSVMTLFSSHSDPYSHAVRIVMAEKGINHETQMVDLANKPAELQDLNPYNEVPTLVDRDLVLYESRIMMEYLDERFPHPPLMPVDPVSRARNRLFLHRVYKDWYSIFDEVMWASKNKAAKARTALAESLTVTAPIFAQKPFFMSEEFTLVDCAIAPLLWRLKSSNINLTDKAGPLVDYGERLFAREGFQASLTEEEKELRL